MLQDIFGRKGSSAGTSAANSQTSAENAKMRQELEAQRAAAAAMASGIDNVTTAIMMVDRDFVVTYVNQASKRILKRHEDTLMSVSPSFNADQVVGACFDVFYNALSSERSRLNDPNNLPFETDIDVAGLTFNIKVSAQIDGSGAYSGNTLEWAEVTEKRKEEAQTIDMVDQLGAVKKNLGSITYNGKGQIMTANDIFLNSMGYKLEDIVGKHHSMLIKVEDRDTPAYKAFWDQLHRNEYHEGQFELMKKDGSIIFIRTTYNPILDPDGTLRTVAQFTIDVTAEVKKGAIANDLGNQIEDRFPQILGSVNQMEAQSGNVLNASENTNQTVQTVAAAVEELQASANEIANVMTESMSSVTRAESNTNEAAQATEDLTNAVNNMTSIVDFIQKIAEQINLLALNATIESARAGDAGRGFAVVAAEVKSLANEVGKATDRIATEISGVQGVAKRVVTSLDGIKESVETVTQNSTGVAGAVEEQSVTISEISSSMQRAADAVRSINDSIDGLAKEASDVAEVTKNVQQLYQELRGMNG